MAALTLQPVVRSDVGRRPNNEDTAFASTRLAAVADGVGGHAAGELASRAVINALIQLDNCRLERRLDEALQDAIRAGNETIAFIGECQPEAAGMGTTLSAVALSDDGCYLLANIGDSRTYLLRDGELTLLTHDDSLVQLLIDRGELRVEDAIGHPHRSIVLAALDGSPREPPAVLTLEARPGDRLLLCSDGLSDVVEDRAIAEALRISGKRACAERLVELALAAGGRDNVSVVIADVVNGRDPSTGWG
jgi:PPM family protein phosphatase